MIYYLIDDLLHLEFLFTSHHFYLELIQKDVTVLFIRIFFYIFVFVHIYYNQCCSCGSAWGGHCPSELSRTEIIKIITISMFYNKILLLVNSFLIFFLKIKKITMTWDIWKSLCLCLSNFFLLIGYAFIGLV